MPIRDTRTVQQVGNQLQTTVPRETSALGYTNFESYAEGAGVLARFERVMKDSGALKVYLQSANKIDVLIEPYDADLESKVDAVERMRSKLLTFDRGLSYPAGVDSRIIDVDTRITKVDLGSITVQFQCVVAFKTEVDFCFISAQGSKLGWDLPRPYGIMEIDDSGAVTIFVDYGLEWRHTGTGSQTMKWEMVAIPTGVPPESWATGGLMNTRCKSRAAIEQAVRLACSSPTAVVRLRKEEGLYPDAIFGITDVTRWHNEGLVNVPITNPPPKGGTMWLSLFIAIITYLLSPKGTDAEKRKALLAAAAAGGLSYVATNYTDWGKDISGSFDDALGLGKPTTPDGDASDGIKVPKPKGPSPGLGGVGGWLPAIIGGAGVGAVASAAPPWVLYAGLGLVAYLVLK